MIRSDITQREERVRQPDERCNIFSDDSIETDCREKERGFQISKLFPTNLPNCYERDRVSPFSRRAAHMEKEFGHVTLQLEDP